MNKHVVGLSISAAVLLSACGTMYRTPCCTAFTADQVPTMVSQPQRIQAVGHGSMGNYSQYTIGQAKLMAMRAAQVDAYRVLAEQVYGYRISGATTVAAFATQNDVVRTYVDTFIRGTRLVSNVSIGDGNFEATVELELPIGFLDCLSQGGQFNRSASGCGAQVPAMASNPSYGY